MEKKRKKSSVDDSMSVKEKPSSEKITFDMFFVKCVREGRLKSWQHKEVAAFFKDMRLKEKEDSEIYEATLGKF